MDIIEATETTISYNTTINRDKLVADRAKLAFKLYNLGKIVAQIEAEIAAIDLMLAYEIGE